MIAVVFEVWPKAEQTQDYLDTAAALRPRLEALPGFVSIERFESLATPGKVLSLTVFQNEQALATWRNTPEHREAQALGRVEYFENYRLHIAEVERDYGMAERAQAPEDSRAVHD